MRSRHRAIRTQWHHPLGRPIGPRTTKSRQAYGESDPVNDATYILTGLRAPALATERRAGALNQDRARNRVGLLVVAVIQVVCIHAVLHKKDWPPCQGRKGPIQTRFTTTR